LGTGLLPIEPHSKTKIYTVAELYYDKETSKLLLKMSRDIAVNPGITYHIYVYKGLKQIHHLVRSLGTGSQIITVAKLKNPPQHIGTVKIILIPIPESAPQTRAKTILKKRKALKKEIQKGAKTLIDIYDIKTLTKIIKQAEAKQRVNRNIINLIAAYREAIELKNQGKNKREIVKHITQKYYVCRTVVYRWLNNQSNPLGQFNIPLLNPSLARCIGDSLSDGVEPFSQESGRVGLRVKNMEHAERFANDLSNVIKRRVKVYLNRSLNVYEVAVNCKILYGLIKYVKTTNDTSILEQIAELYGANICTGYFDGDGYASDKLGIVAVSSINMQLIEFISRILNKLGIHHSVYTQRLGSEIEINGKTYHRKVEKNYIIYIRHCCLKRFAELIGFSIPEKKMIMEKILKSIKFRKQCPTTV